MTRGGKCPLCPPQMMPLINRGVLWAMDLLWALGPMGQFNYGKCNSF